MYRRTQGRYSKGGTLGDILVGSHLEVYGPLVGGIVTATKVEFETETELQANVAAVDPAASTLTLAGLSGLTIEFDSQTALSGKGTPDRSATFVRRPPPDTRTTARRVCHPGKGSGEKRSLLACSDAGICHERLESVAGSARIDNRYIVDS